MKDVYVSEIDDERAEAIVVLDVDQDGTGGPRTIFDIYVLLTFVEVDGDLEGRRRHRPEAALRRRDGPRRRTDATSTTSARPGTLSAPRYRARGVLPARAAGLRSPHPHSDPRSEERMADDEEHPEDEATPRTSRTSRTSQRQTSTTTTSTPTSRIDDLLVDDDAVATTMTTSCSTSRRRGGREVVAPVKAKRDDDDEEDEDEEEADPDDVEADLDAILKDRIAAAEEEEDDEEEEAPEPEESGDGTGRIQPKRPGEFVCQSCFLVKHPSQLADAKRKLCADCV